MKTPPRLAKPTMRDVSRLARVSPMTVSRVFADPSSVAEATRERVMTAVEQLGYVRTSWPARSPPGGPISSGSSCRRSPTPISPIRRRASPRC